MGNKAWHCTECLRGRSARRVPPGLRQRTNYAFIKTRDEAEGTVLYGNRMGEVEDSGAATQSVAEVS